MDNNNISFEDLTGKRPDPQVPKKHSKGFAIASMVLGILSVMCCCFEYFSIVMAIVAVVFFAVDRRTNGKSNGMAIAGLVLGIFGIVLSVFSILSTILFKDFYEQYSSIYSSMLDDFYGETREF